MTTLTFEAQAVEKVVAELGLKLQYPAEHVEWDEAQECRLLSRSAVVQALYATAVDRYRQALSCGDDDEAGEFHAEADGVRYALMAFVPFEAALGLKHAAYDEAVRSLAG